MNAPHSQPDSGFVLPYVLVVIAILAIASTIAAQRLQKATQIVGELQDRTRAERVLISAEAAATYSILTGNTAQGGYDLSPESLIKWEFGLLSADGKTPFREDDTTNTTKDIWRGNGHLRQYSMDRSPAAALIAYRDATGLISLNKGNERRLLSVLKASGATPVEARKLVATLLDYIDVDDTRRSDGAESFNYRTQNLPPPANAPLRSYAELGQIMGWAGMLPRLDMRTLKDMTTLKQGSGYRQSFASDHLKQVIGVASEDPIAGRDNDIFQELNLNNTNPSQFARFTLWASRSDGRYQKRVVDIERFVGGVGEPYRRHWVYDSTVLESDLIPYAGPSSSRQNAPLQFDELDHVVHAPSLRP